MYYKNLCGKETRVRFKTRFISV